jgi:hypothetical protein
MPKAGNSNDHVQKREDEIARILEAREQVERIRALGVVLRRRHAITTEYFSDLNDSLDCIVAALLLGKQNTAALRRLGTREEMTSCHTRRYES